MDWLDLGLFGLFTASFLAATIVPFSSEAILIAALYAGLDPISCLTAATFGNWLGGMTSYGLGWFGNLGKIKSWLKVDNTRLQYWEKPIQQFGFWFGLLCWLPIIGDVIAIALGLFRTPLILSALTMLAGKSLRYIAIGYGFGVIMH
ncbi:MAG: YqaA family protein [Salibacteraceae bacterium]